MLRNFRTIVVAFTVLLIVAAGAIATAQAAKLTIGATVTAKDLGAGSAKLIRLTVGNGARFVECEESIIAAEIPLSGVEEVEVAPIQGSCFANGLPAVPSTVTVNGCTYRFQFSSATAAQAYLVCPAEKQMEVHVYESAAGHKAGSSLCTYDFASQGPIAGAITLGQENEGSSEDIKATIKLEKIAITSTVGAAGVCGVKGPASTTGLLAGSATVAANVGGVQVGLMTG